MSRVMTVRDGTLNAVHEQRMVTGRRQHCLLMGGDIPPAETEVKGLGKGLSRTVPRTSAVSGTSVKWSHSWQSQPSS